MVYAVHFDPAKTELKREAKGILNEVAEVIRRHPTISVRIEGHTDSKPIHTSRFRSNYELSMGRANAVLDYLRIEHGIAVSISISGYGMARPAATNLNPERRARNRRTEIILSRED